jgi:hypothetical protein
VRRTTRAIGPTLPVPEKKPPPERARINTAPKAAGAPQ